MKKINNFIFLFAALGAMLGASITYVFLSNQSGQAAILSASTSTTTWKKIKGTTDISFMGGKVGIGTVAPTEALEVAGTVKATAFAGDGALLTGLPIPNVTGILNQNGLSFSTGKVTIAGSAVANSFCVGSTCISSLKKQQLYAAAAGCSKGAGNLITTASSCTTTSYAVTGCGTKLTSTCYFACNGGSAISAQTCSNPAIGYLVN